ncbi:uncharacterized protein BDW47DRAFT_20217 [Aspergillus candidus]|uniref:Uncharacterized protein n=1 Tax=Aspergillus candidus TaxID=41067 RepID=A0A2I2FDW2_ASPCN|nr:hypothetical protein BDW47DRAFT_20217 [Aspergillus candidus]PLB38812.1 hypothetical protein BDW47DRAFT_20217 [Aspergillus candidus]
MARKRPAPVDTPEEPLTQTPQKRARKPPTDKKPVIHAPHPPSPSLSPNDKTQGAQCVDPVTVEKELYTEAFFADMAYTIARIFPFEQFAEKHGCAVSLVSQALMATMIAPWSDPSFDWQEDPDWTIVRFGEGMVDNWKRYYNDMMENCRPPCPGWGDDDPENFPTSPTATSSSDDETSGSTYSTTDQSETTQQEIEGASSLSKPGEHPVARAPPRSILKKHEISAVGGRSKKSLSWQEEEDLSPR